MEKISSFLKLLQSVDALFPVGAFTLSNGLEDYVVCERIRDIEDLREYLAGFMQLFPYHDLGIMALAHRQFQEDSFILELDHTAAACKGAREVREGTRRMCLRYLKAREAMGDCQRELARYRDAVAKGQAYGIHPIALGIYGAQVGIAPDLLLIMYGYSVLSAIVNNAVKLVPLGQLEGQRVLFSCMGELETLSKKAIQVELDEIGLSGAAQEYHCMHHEMLYSRQYSS